MRGHRFVHDRRERRIVRHRERLQLAELPVNGFVVRVISAETEFVGHCVQPLVKRDEARQIRHAEGNVKDAADFLGEFGLNMQDMRFVGAENADGTPGFVAV